MSASNTQRSTKLWCKELMINMYHSLIQSTQVDFKYLKMVESFWRYTWSYCWEQIFHLSTINCIIQWLMDLGIIGSALCRGKTIGNDDLVPSKIHSNKNFSLNVSCSKGGWARSVNQNWYVVKSLIFCIRQNNKYSCFPSPEILKSDERAISYLLS